MTEQDADLLEQAQDLEDHAREHIKARIAVQQEAEQVLKQWIPETAVVSTESKRVELFEAKYKKEGRKEGATCGVFPRVARRV